MERSDEERAQEIAERNYEASTERSSEDSIAYATNKIAAALSEARAEGVAAEREAQVERIRDAIESCAKLLEFHADEILKSVQGLDTGVIHRASAWRWAASAIRLQKPSESAAKRDGNPQ